MMTINANYTDKILTLSNLPEINQRKLMKIKIYLNQLEILNYNFDEANLKIEFLIGDRNIIMKYISNIATFIEIQADCKISLNEETVNSINFLKQNNEDFKISLSKLKLLKNSENINSITEYVEFCKFCDSTLSCTLRSYQYKAAFYLSVGKGGFDFSVPGSGKTIISYAAFNFYKYNGLCNYILIIGPLNSYNAWNDEYETCFGIKPSFESLANCDLKSAVTYLLSSSSNHAEITFLNIDKAWRLTNELVEFCRGKKVLLIIDEAHKEKNPNSEITKSVLEVTKHVDMRIILTGTPMPNGYEDLFSLMKIYSPYEKILPYSYQELKRLTKKGVTDEQRNSIMDSLAPVYSRVSKKYLLDVGELLPAKFTVENCDFSYEQNLVYDFLNEIACKIDNDFESTLNSNLLKALVIRKMQVSANPALLTKSIISSIDEYRDRYVEEYTLEDSSTEQLIEADNYLKKLIADSSIVNIINKFDLGICQINKNLRAVELAKDLIKKNEKVILWDVFVQNMNNLKRMLEEQGVKNVELVNGTILGQDRQNALNNFKNGSCMVLVANPATLAESISLHKCCQNAIYVNKNFNAAQFIQSKDRIHRINMPKGKTANYIFLVNKDSIDIEIQTRLELKEKRMIDILDADIVEIGGFEFEVNSFMSNEDVINSYRK